MLSGVQDVQTWLAAALCARCSSSFEDGQTSLIPEGFLPVSARVPRSAVDHPELAVGREGLQELPGLAELVLAVAVQGWLPDT